jgi:hypothetical protein
VTIQTLSDAIEAHATWVRRFESAISRTGGELPRVEDVRDDAACEFGRWLQANPAILGPDRYLSLVNLHQAFHEEAARIAETLQSRPARAVAATLKVRMDYLSMRLIDAMLDAERELRARQDAAGGPDWLAEPAAGP